MIHLDCARRVTAISLAAILILSAGAADARGRAHQPLPIPKPRPTLNDTAVNVPEGVSLQAPVLSIISEDPATQTSRYDTPTIVKSLRRIYCVEFARLRSGIAIFGDAKTWWDKARAEYAEVSDPRQGAVMVFAGTRKMTRGHVAVVTRIVSSREIRVDHANWRRDGNIYLNAPVIDVSPNNDWSKVRVWDTGSGQLGSNTYPIKGFVAFRTAANN